MGYVEISGNMATMKNKKWSTLKNHDRPSSFYMVFPNDTLPETNSSHLKAIVVFSDDSFTWEDCVCENPLVSLDKASVFNPYIVSE